MAVLGGPPSPRSFHAAALLGTHMFVFGGWNHLQSAPAAYNDITALDTATGAWHTIQCSGIFPAERYGHAAVALAADHMIFFGGCDLRKYETIIDRLFFSFLSGSHCLSQPIL